MADKPEVLQLPITSEKKKNPKRVEAGKRLAAISKIAKERKRKQAESAAASSGGNLINHIGVAIALISLVIVYRTNQREEKALEPKCAPPTVSMEKQPDRSNIDTLE
jgi:hypothetical protein